MQLKSKLCEQCNRTLTYACGKVKVVKSLRLGPLNRGLCGGPMHILWRCFGSHQFAPLATVHKEGRKLGVLGALGVSLKYLGLLLLV